MGMFKFNIRLSQWRTQKIFMGGFIQWHMVVNCNWCARFVTSQFDVIFMFPNQRFGEVCWHNRHILLHVLPYFMCHCTVYKLSAFQVRLSEENKLNATTQQFITAKISGIALNRGVKHIHNHERPQKLFHGGQRRHLYMVFGLLAKQCERTFTKHFNLFKPQRKCAMLGQ